MAKQLKSEIKIIFIGTPEFGAVILEKLAKSKYKPILVITSLDKKVGRKQILTPPPVKLIAQKYKIPVLQIKKIKSKRVIKKIKNLKPDLIIVASFAQIIPAEILKIPTFGCLNVHPSLLPKYRGPSPIQTTILNEEKETGVTIILMDKKIDHGPIVAQEKIKIKKERYIELEKKLANLGGKLLLKILPKIIKREIKLRDQDHSKASFTKIFKKEDGKIDWAKPAEVIEREIRAFERWPQSFTFLNLKNKKVRIKILEAKVQKQSKKGPFGTIGKIFLAPNDKIAIQCGKDYLIVEKIQLEGKKEMKIEDFLKGHLDIIGKVFE